MRLNAMALLGLIGLSATLPAQAQAVGDIWQNPMDGMEFVWIPEGVLQLESAPDHASDTTITFAQGFWMGRTEVTVGQFRRFVEATGYTTEAERSGNRFTWRNPDYRQTDEHPVVYVSAEDARRYARWAEVDLPTEAEWLYAHTLADRRPPRRRRARSRTSLISMNRHTLTSIWVRGI